MKITLRTLPLYFLLAVGSTGCEGETSSASQKTIQQYETHCARCHDVGAANAPKRGEAQAWEKRLRKGEATLVKNVKEGLVAMPPRGGCDGCSDEDFKALINYLAE